MRRTLQALRKALRRRMHRDVYETGRWLAQVLRGWLQSYAVPTSHRNLGTLVYQPRCGCSEGGRRRTASVGTGWNRSAAGCGRRGELSIHGPGTQLAVRVELHEDPLTYAHILGNVLDKLPRLGFRFAR